MYVKELYYFSADLEIGFFGRDPEFSESEVVELQIGSGQLRTEIMVELFFISNSSGFSSAQSKFAKYEGQFFKNKMGLPKNLQVILD